MDRITARDRRDAQKWVMKMLDEPHRHGAALARWIDGKTGRAEIYHNLLGDVHTAARAAASAPLRASQAKSQLSRWPVLIAVASAVIVLIGGGYFLRSQWPAQQGDPAHHAHYQTVIGEMRTVRLGDGSSILLDTATTIDVALSDHQRLVTLQNGRARFHVALDTTRPFIVRMGDSAAFTTGSVFDLSFSNRIKVDAVEGNVAIRNGGWRNNASLGHGFQVASGQSLSFISGQRQPLTAMTARPSDLQWINGVKNLDDVPIADVIAEANSYSIKKIILADPAWAQREIFGNIYIRDIDAVADTIARFLGARVDRSNPQRLIITK